eukprot:TRINITY_DN1523_c0_g2_i1.p1 TRINITY_DN1523_c0_g2~~TRINITY_DN1523_c0_g2_i1.p1  ORF type:complete len:181 (+),score=1.07 TRINITY_DN1523_c0_g2_i1:89-631(+)
MSCDKHKEDLKTYCKGCKAFLCPSCEAHDAHEVTALGSDQKALLAGLDKIRRSIAEMGSEEIGRKLWGMNRNLKEFNELCNAPAPAPAPAPRPTPAPAPASTPAPTSAPPGAPNNRDADFRQCNGCRKITSSGEASMPCVVHLASLRCSKCMKYERSTDFAKWPWKGYPTYAYFCPSCYE